MMSERSTPLSKWELAKAKWEIVAVSSTGDPASTITRPMVSSRPSETSLKLLCLMEASWTFWNFLLVVMWDVSAFGPKVPSELRWVLWHLASSSLPQEKLEPPWAQDAQYRPQQDLEKPRHPKSVPSTTQEDSSQSPKGKFHWKTWESCWSSTHMQRPCTRTPFLDRPRATKSGWIGQQRH